MRAVTVILIITIIFAIILLAAMILIFAIEGSLWEGWLSLVLFIIAVIIIIWMTVMYITGEQVTSAKSMSEILSEAAKSDAPLPKSTPPLTIERTYVPKSTPPPIIEPQIPETTTYLPETTTYLPETTPPLTNGQQAVVGKPELYM